jgi:hypothetical protein
MKKNTEKDGTKKGRSNEGKEQRTEERTKGTNKKQRGTRTEEIKR